MDKNQIIRYSEAEKAIIQKTFKEDEVLYALRNFFWQLELTDIEKTLLKFEEDSLKIIKKVMLPDIERDVPLGQQADETLDPLLQQLNLMNPALAVIMIDANDLRVKYLTQQFNKIINGKLDIEEGDIILKDLKKPMSVDQDEIRHINMLAYKSTREYIDGRINEFKYFANPPKPETDEEKKKREIADSSV